MMILELAFSIAMMGQSATDQLVRSDRDRPQWSLLLPAVQAARERSEDDGERATAVRRTETPTSTVQDSHDRLANQELSHVVQQRAPQRSANASTPAARGVRMQQGRVLLDADFVRFYKSAGDAKIAATGGARASSHRRIMPLAIAKRVDSASSVVIGTAITNCAVGNSYPDLTLKRGTMVIEAKDATITHCGANKTAMSVELTSATVAQIRTEQQN
ncbi:MAG: hypothetical protein ABJ239_07225 [Erythrobacter sp.]